MNSFASGFLDAPLLVDAVQDAILRFARHDRLVREMHGMSDIELRDMCLTRADIPRIIKDAAHTKTLAAH